MIHICKLQKDDICKIEYQDYGDIFITLKRSHFRLLSMPFSGLFWQHGNTTSLQKEKQSKLRYSRVGRYSFENIKFLGEKCVVNACFTSLTRWY